MEPLTITDIMQKCKTLQDNGYNVSFEVAYGDTRIEHRGIEDCKLIAGFTMRDTENQKMLAAVMGYLDLIGK